MAIPSHPSLNPAQQKVIEYGVLDSGFSVVLQMPTGSGKTFLAREAVRTSVQRGFRAVYLSPLRALADELAASWKQTLTDFEVGVFTGDYGANGKAFPVPYSKAQVLIMTPERLDACTRNWRSHWGWIPEVDWVVVDEIHLLGDGNRGARLEGTISRFRRLNPFSRILGLSATLGNRGDLADWLEGVELKSDWRAVPLKWQIEHYRKPDEKPGMLARNVQRNRDKGGQSIVFVQSRRRAEELARYLVTQGLSATHHHAGLTHVSRQKTEASFRLGDVQTLVATGTLEMGLNLPARQVVLYDLQGFDGEGFSPLAVNTVWQRAGRAGRPGLDSEGEAVLLAHNRDRHAEGYLRGQFEEITSQFTHPAALAEQILIEVHSGLAQKEAQLERIFATSLACIGPKGFARKSRPSLPVRPTLEKMLDSGMLWYDEEKQRLTATRLGRIACRHQLQPDTVLLIRRCLEASSKLTYFDLLLILAATPDCSPILPVDFEELEQLADELPAHSSTLLANPAPAWTTLGISGKRALSALKTAKVLLRWTECGDTETVAEEDDIYPFELHRLIETFDRLLLAATSIQRTIELPITEHDDEKPGGQIPELPKSDTLQRLELLHPMILHGLDESAASLTLIKGIGAKWAAKLSAHGYRNLGCLAEAKPAKLARLPGLSLNRAKDWIRESRQLPALLPLESTAPKISTIPVDFDLEIDPYRLRRSLDLSVKSSGKNHWLVTGGLEPHAVTGTPPSFSCNCADFLKHRDGHACKHILAVRMHNGEESLKETVFQLETSRVFNHLDLFQLWFDRSQPIDLKSKFGHLLR